jgi:proteasome regulatory subunit
MLDRAILRPGRFDRLIEVPEPNQEGRERILDIHTEGMDIADDVSYEAVADLTDGFTGAELASLVTEAGMFAIRRDRTVVEMEDFEEAYEKVANGDDTAGTPIAFQ